MGILKKNNKPAKKYHEFFKMHQNRLKNDIKTPEPFLYYSNQHSRLSKVPKT